MPGSTLPIFSQVSGDSPGLLRALLSLAADHLSVPLALPGQAGALTDASRDLGLEGVVLKRLASFYQPGQRSGDWLKIRHPTAADVLIGGWLPRAGTRTAGAGEITLPRVQVVYESGKIHGDLCPRPDTHLMYMINIALTMEFTTPASGVR